jgi:hypothetical protein
MGMTVAWLNDIIQRIPIFETVLFLVLAMITVFRRRLSSNDAYRSRQEQQNRQIATPSSAQLSSSNTSSKNRDIIELYSKYASPGMSISSLGTAISRRLGSSGADSGLNSPMPSNTVSGHNLDLLSCDIFIHVANYLSTAELLRVSTVNRRLSHEARGDRLWRERWRQSFLTLWTHPYIRDLRNRRGLHWQSDLSLRGQGQTSWLHFYVLFEASWVDWLLAGFCTADKCVVCIDKRLYDVTAFMLDHPGSPETMSEGAGCDATENYRDIGHSSFADSLLKRFCMFDPNAAQTDDIMGDISSSCQSLASLDAQSSSCKRSSEASSKLLQGLRSLQKKLVWQANERNQRALQLRLGQRNSSWRKLVGRDEPLNPPASIQLVPELTGYLTCEECCHAGTAKAFFDPLRWEWVVWWSCCGAGFSVGNCCSNDQTLHSLRL